MYTIKQVNKTDKYYPVLFLKIEYTPIPKVVGSNPSSPVRASLYTIKQSIYSLNQVEYNFFISLFSTHRRFNKSTRYDSIWWPWLREDDSTIITSTFREQRHILTTNIFRPSQQKSKPHTGYFNQLWCSL